MGQAWICGLVLGGGAFVRDDLKSEPLDRFVCRASEVSVEGIWLERVGPVGVEWDAALAWCRSAASSVWVEVEGRGRWHDGPAEAGSPSVPHDFLEQLSPTRWGDVHARTWTATVRLSLGKRDFTAAVRHLQQQNVVGLIQGAECTVDEDSWSIEMRCRVVAPTVALASQLSGEALRYWVSGSEGLEDDLRTTIGVTTVDIASADGSPLPFQNALEAVSE